MNSTLENNTANHSLHHLVDEIIRDFSSEQFIGRSQIANKVSTGLFICTTEEGVLFSVISGMLHAFLSNTTEGEIEVSARELAGNTMKVRVRDANCYNTYAVACSLQRIVPMAESIGGFLNIVNQRQKITTIEFSFPFEKELQLSSDDL